MIRIAVCDDMQYYVENLSVMIGNWATERCMNLQLKSFTSGEEILWAAEEEGSFCAVFIDVELTGINGIETAAGLRKIDRYTNVIFVSQYDNYFRQMFEVHPCYFIEKPLSEKKVFQILDRIMEEKRHIYAMYDFSFNRCNHRIFLRKVLYFFSERRRIHVITEDYREYMFYMKLDNVESELADYDVEFIRINKSYLVNSRQVERFYAKYVIMSNGERLSISRDYRENVHNFHRKVLEVRC